MSLNMPIEFGEALDFTGTDFRRWRKEVGFTSREVIHLAGHSSSAIAYRRPTATDCYTIPRLRASITASDFECTWSLA